MSEDNFERALACWQADLDRLKKTWLEGPWSEELDRIEWIGQPHRGPRGYPCLIIRSITGALNGYVAVPPGHPAHGNDYDDLDVSVHGGLTYAGKGGGVIQHAEEEPGSYWFGFDCAHAFDITPSILSTGMLELVRRSDEWQYRNIAYVREQVESLAEQLADMVDAKLEAKS